MAPDIFGEPGNDKGQVVKEPWLGRYGTLKQFFSTDWVDLLHGEWAANLRAQIWSTEAMRGWLVQLYPFIHTFPKMLSEVLLKVEDDTAQTFLLDNIERYHAEHWIWMAESFGVPREELLAIADGERTVLRDVQSLTDWMWHVSIKGTFAEALAATFAIQGSLGLLGKSLLEPLMAYRGHEGVSITPRTATWFQEHIDYARDDECKALYLIGRYAKTDRERWKAMNAWRRSVQLLNLALLTSTKTHPTEPLPTPQNRPVPAEHGSSSRLIPFPKRTRSYETL